MKYNLLNNISKLKFFLIRFSGEEENIVNDAKMFSKTFRDIYSSAEYKTLKQNLLKGLDRKSITTVNRILKRVSLFLKNNQKVFLRESIEFYNVKTADKYKQSVLKTDGKNWFYEGYVLPRRHFNDQIFWDKYFMEEFKTLDKIRQKDILDVGGFIGDSAILFEKYTDAKVRVYEPVESNYKDLIKTIKLNNSEKIIPYQFALGSQETEMYINNFESTGVGATLRKDRDNYPGNIREKIKIKTLDEVVKEENLQIGLIKVDVEGAEQDFLAGAMETIKTQKPALLLAIYHTGEDFFEIKTKIENLNLGYKFKIRKATKDRIIDDTVLICEVL